MLAQETLNLCHFLFLTM